jgi:predicted kinase
MGSEMPRSDADAGSLQDRIARDFRTQIEAGLLHDGESLPSTRALAEQWGVSIFTINQAMKVLADEGLIENQSRSRRIVRSGKVESAQIRRLRPHAVLIGGFAGSGKTELGRILARLTGWTMIDKDTITRPIVEFALEALGQPTYDRESDLYHSQIRPREYETLMATAHENTSCGAGAIVTAPFLKEFTDASWLEREQSLFADEDATLTLVWVHCDPETMRTYLRRRGAARDTVKLSDWPAYLDSIELEMRPITDHVLIDNSATAEPLKSQAERLVRQFIEQP